jgi:hypothetical protein
MFLESFSFYLLYHSKELCSKGHKNDTCINPKDKKRQIYVTIRILKKLFSKSECIYLYTAHHTCSSQTSIRLSQPVISEKARSKIVPYKNGFSCKTKLHGLSQRANYTDRATAACRRSDCQLVRIEGATWST